LNGGNFAVRNHDGGRVTLTDQHHAAIMVLILRSKGADMAVEAIKKKEFSSDHVERGMQ
jgi:hypothetical protein